MKRPFCPTSGGVRQPDPLREGRWFSEAAKGEQIEGISGHDFERKRLIAKKKTIVTGRARFCAPTLSIWLKI